MGYPPAKIPIVIGNWKMHKTVEETKRFIDELLPLIKTCSMAIGLAVPSTSLYIAAQEVQDFSVAIGAQDVSEWENEGPYTGEISSEMLKEAGACFAIVGHSERRHLFKETDTSISKKVANLLRSNLKSIICIGETREEHQENKTHQVLKKQLLEGLKSVLTTDFGSIIIAYEPIWAIGTGKPADAGDVQNVLHFCREVVEKKWGKSAAQRVKILYGGSVSPENAPSFFSQEDIDGLLVGNNALSVASFSKIVNCEISMKERN